MCTGVIGMYVHLIKHVCSLCQSLPVQVIKHTGVRHPQGGKVFLDLEGLDLLDGTLVLDIKVVSACRS